MFKSTGDKLNIIASHARCFVVVACIDKVIENHAHTNWKKGIILLSEFRSIPNSRVAHSYCFDAISLNFRCLSCNNMQQSQHMQMRNLNWHDTLCWTVKRKWKCLRFTQRSSCSCPLYHMQTRADKNNAHGSRVSRRFGQSSVSQCIWFEFAVLPE